MKSKKRASSLKWLSLPILLICLMALVLARTAQGQASAPDNPLQAAWQQARQAGAYDYSTTIIQTTWPLPQLENVGLSSSQQRIYIEGAADLSAETLAMKLWTDGGNAQTAQDAIDIRVADGKAVGRVAHSDWREVDDMTGLFAPNRDLLTFLAAAKDVRRAAPESRGGLTVTRYTFDVDGPAFAAYMRDQLEAELTRKGTLPVGVNLDVARQYVGMTGQGELWLNVDGLPLRQVMHLKFPPEHLEQIEVEITTDFSGWHEAVAQDGRGQCHAAGSADGGSPHIRSVVGAGNDAGRRELGALPARGRRGVGSVSHQRILAADGGDVHAAVYRSLRDRVARNQRRARAAGPIFLPRALSRGRGPRRV